MSSISEKVAEFHQAARFERLSSPDIIQKTKAVRHPKGGGGGTIAVIKDEAGTGSTIAAFTMIYKGHVASWDSDTDTIIITGVDCRSDYPIDAYVWNSTDRLYCKILSSEYTSGNTIVQVEPLAGHAFAGLLVVAYGDEKTIYCSLPYYKPDLDQCMPYLHKNMRLSVTEVSTARKEEIANIALESVAGGIQTKFTMTAATSFIVGDSVTITGLEAPLDVYNGTWSVTAVAADTVTILAPFVAGTPLQYFGQMTSNKDEWWAAMPFQATCDSGIMCVED